MVRALNENSRDVMIQNISERTDLIRKLSKLQVARDSTQKNKIVNEVDGLNRPIDRVARKE